MKRCPQCRSTYTDPTLSYCLTDGTALEDYDSGKTEAFEVADSVNEGPARKTEDARVNIGIPARDENPTAEARKPFESSEEKKTGTNFGLIGLAVFLLVIVVAAVSVGITYVLLNRDGETGQTGVDELGNKSGNESARSIEGSLVPDEDDPAFDDEMIQRVNSPGDGFLALRDRPSAKVGRRLAKIPHGDIVVIGICQAKTEKIGSRTGRWCPAKWKGKYGWVFDVWLID